MPQKLERTTNNNTETYSHIELLVDREVTGVLILHHEERSINRLHTILRSNGPLSIVV